jgi:positive regulator of sigma E activity
MDDTASSEQQASCSDCPGNANSGTYLMVQQSRRFNAALPTE